MPRVESIRHSQPRMPSIDTRSSSVPSGLIGSRRNSCGTKAVQRFDSVECEIPTAGVDFSVSNSLMSSCHAFEFRLVANGSSRSA